MTVPDNFQLLGVPLPPMLLGMAGVKGDSEFVGLHYSSSKATWTDGRSIATFPFYTVWQPYIWNDGRSIATFPFYTAIGALLKLRL